MYMHISGRRSFDTEFDWDIKQLNIVEKPQGAQILQQISVCRRSCPGALQKTMENKFKIQHDAIERERRKSLNRDQKPIAHFPIILHR